MDLDYTLQSLTPSGPSGVWSIRQQERDVVLPHKRRLEGLLKELDGQE